MKQFPEKPDAVNRINWRISDFCDAHGIGRTSFYEEVKRGNIKVIKHGARTLISDEEAKSWQSRLVNGGKNER